jgi:hypothetical protein
MVRIDHENLLTILWRVELGGGELGTAVKSPSDQHLPVREQRRSVKFADVVHRAGITQWPGVGRRVVEKGVARNTVLVPPSSDLGLSGTEQRQCVAADGRGDIILSGHVHVFLVGL